MHNLIKGILVIFGVLFLIVLSIKKIDFKTPILEPTVKQAIETIPQQKPIVEKQQEPPLNESLPEFTNYTEALKAAKQLNKNMFIYFETDWCGWCKKMKSEVLSDSEVKDKLNKNFIVCMINVDKDRQTARKFKASGVPTYLIVDKEESIIEKGSGFKTKDKFLDWLEPKNVSALND